jgi:outer membrane protein OmpA-like peptidoglycan-associated protein
MYSNIVILGASVLFASDLWPARERTVGLLAPLALQAVLRAKKGPSVASFGSLSSQQQTSRPSRSKVAATVSPRASEASTNPPFLRRPIPFAPNSLELDVAAKATLNRAATWLRQHGEARILIVGSCDSGGSETCTHTLAEARAAVVQKFLGSAGIHSDQIVGVKGWDSLDQSCLISDGECQKTNRSTRIFIASSVAH